MPLKIIASRNKKTKNLYIRGSYLGVSVDQSARTDRRSLAIKVQKRIEAEIERGEYKRPPAPGREQRTFIAAAINYLETGHRAQYVEALVEYFQDMPLSDIDQAAIDQAAIAIKPNGTPMNRTAAVYTPISAILHFAGVDITVRRPKGFAGKERSDWLVPADAFGIIDAADSFDPEFATLLTWLLYTGARIGAALDLRREDVRLDEQRAWARSQKGQPHMDVRLHPDLCARLAPLLATDERTRVFRLHYGGHLIHQLVRARLKFLGLACPKRPPPKWREPPNRLAWVTFHSFRHTFASWMRLYANASMQDLVDTGNWRNERSARRYVHSKAHNIWDAAQNLPSMKKVI